MTKKAFIVSTLFDSLPAVDSLNEILTPGELLKESDFNGCIQMRFKGTLPSTKFKRFLHELGAFVYGTNTINNYNNMLTSVYSNEKATVVIRMPIIKQTAAIDIAISCFQQEIFFPDGRRPDYDKIEGDIAYGKLITSAFLAIDGYEKLALELSSKFEPKAQRVVSARLLYSTVTSRVIWACAYMAEWVELANQTNEYGYNKAEWERWAKRRTAEELRFDKQFRPERNVIADELKEYLLRLELEASKAISYIIAYNNLPDHVLSENKAWKREGLSWCLTIEDLRSYNLQQIEAIKRNLAQARESLHRHFGILSKPALAYPNQIYPNNIFANVLPHGTYMFFSRAVESVTSSVPVDFFSGSETTSHIYKPPYGAPKNSIDADIIAMESNSLKNNSSISALVESVNPQSHESAAAQSLLMLHRDCNDALTSAIKCLSFAHMRYASYMEQNYSEYQIIFSGYIERLIAPAVRSLVLLFEKTESIGMSIQNRQSIVLDLNEKLDKLTEMVPRGRVNGEFVALPVSDLLAPVQREIQALHEVDEHRVQNAVALYRNFS